VEIGRYWLADEENRGGACDRGSGRDPSTVCAQYHWIIFGAEPKRKIRLSHRTNPKPAVTKTAPKMMNSLPSRAMDRLPNLGRGCKNIATSYRFLRPRPDPFRMY
jgi:hypothetical protein